MCTDDTPAGHVHPAPLLHDFEPSVTFDLEPVDSYQLELENVSDAIRGEAELLLGREDAVAQARVLEELHSSAMSAHSGS